MTVHFERPTAFTFASQASTGAFWNKLLTAIEGAIADIQDQVTDIATVQADLAAQLAEIQATLRRVAIVGSWTSGAGGDGSLLTATDAGDGTVTIGVKPHTRHYSADTAFAPVALAGGDTTGFTFGTTYYGSYVDSTLTNGTPTFEFSTDPKEHQANVDEGRHPLGAVTAPAAAGDPPSSGGGALPPAGGGGGTAIP